LSKLLKNLFLIGVLVTLLLQIAPSVSGSSAPATFGNPILLQSITGPDLYPTVLQDSNFTLWVAWEHRDLVSSQIVYKTSNGLAWSAPQNLTTGTWFNRDPSLSQLKNGTIILVWSSSQTGIYLLYYKTFTRGVWSSPVQLTSGTFNDLSPKTVLARDSTLWLVWQRNTGTTSRQIYYKTLKGNTWSGDTPLTTDTLLHVTPGAMVGKDGSIWVVWSTFITSTQLDVSYRTFNGTTWSGDIPLTSKNYDLSPEFVQDRNGTIWSFCLGKSRLGP
jgi:hypothetical protein